MNAAARMKAMLVDPLAEWTRVEKESDDTIYVLTVYVALLALIPAVFGFIGGCIIGVTAPGAGTLRVPLFDGLLGAIFGYLLTFAKVLLVGLLIEVLAPAFGARRNLANALKLATYSFTPLWVVGIFLGLPGLRFLEIAGFYGAYVLAKGLPGLMRSPRETSPLYAAFVVIFASVLTVIAAEMQSELFGTAAL
jgi:hypothetical protein